MKKASPMHTSYAVLLAGGAGTRLWPVSRELYPKQLAKFIGKDSLVQATLKRLVPALNMEQVRIVCGQEHVHEIKRHMVEIGISAAEKIICEPCGRNTAPAVLLSVFNILEKEADANICIFPADHVIRNIEDFHSKILAALTLANQGYVVTFGIKPHYPETGYGYIEGSEEMAEDAHRIKRFVEKPDKKTAEKYLDAGNFFWNSGMFAFKASVILDEFKMLSPDLFHGMQQLIQNGPITLDGYQALPDISIDYAIMEKTHRGVVLPSDFGWSDIGSWKSLYDFLDRDENNNVIEGDVIDKDTKNCLILSHERLIATNSLRNMAIVETPDSVFISDLDNSREVKEIVERLKAQGRKEFKTHRTAYYPWGKITILEEAAGFSVQRIVIYPNGAYLNETDRNRVRHHTVASGQAILTEDGQQKTLKKGNAFRISKKDVTIENRQTSDLVLIQVEIAR